MLDSFCLADVGVVLIDENSHALYCNPVARDILRYPNAASGSVENLLRQKDLQRLVTNSPGVMTLRSGRRRYYCRAFKLSSPGQPKTSAVTALIIERAHRLAVSRQHLVASYRLTPRECEVTELLTLGFSNKEIADRLGVTPNTVKMFLKLVMSKMRVSSRAGVIGKLLHRAA